MSMYTLFREVFPPTGVEHAVQANFISSNVTNLIVAKTSILQIFTVVTEHAPDSQTNTEISVARLELFSQYKLHGNIASIGVVKTVSSGGDSLLLSFKDAKLSLIEFSPETNNIVTVSIHYYERDDFRKEFMHNNCPTEVRVDPANRCAILNFYGDKLAILPFRQKEVLHLVDEEVSSKWPYSPSFVIDGSSIQKNMRNIIDMVFLEDYYEPTLAILYEPIQTNTVLLSTRKDTCAMVVVSLDLTKKLYPVIYSIDSLPYDCIKLIPVPKPIGGILVVSANALIHVDQSSPGQGIAVNGHASKCTNFPLEERHELGIALEGSQHVFLSSDKLLILLKNGDFYIVELIQNGRSLSSIRMAKAGTSVLPSCACKVLDQYFFLGSRLGDSLLIKYFEKKSQPISMSLSEDHEKSNAMDLDLDLYGNDYEISDETNEENHSAASLGSMYSFQVCDNLINTGPVNDMSVGESANISEEFQLSDDKKPFELVLCSGNGKNGALSVLQRNIRPLILSSFNLPGCQEIWSARCKREVIFEGIVQVQSARGLKGHLTEADDEDEGFDRFLILSQTNRTMVLSAGEELQELENADFFVEGPTIAVGGLLNETRVVQVYSSGIRLLNAEGKLTQLVPVGNNSLDTYIVAANIIDPYIIVLYSNGKVTLLKADPKSKDVTVFQIPTHINQTPISSCCLFSDNQRLFETNEDRSAFRETKQGESKAQERKNDTSDGDLDDIDMDLYGDAEDDVEIMDSKEDNKPSMDVDGVPGFLNEENISRGDSKATYWCLICRENGTLEIYSLPDLEEVFYFPRFDLAPGLLSDSPQQRSTLGTSQNIPIDQIVVVKLGKKRPSTYVMAHNRAGDTSVYQPFHHISTNETNEAGSGQTSKPINFSKRLALRFSRTRLDMITRDPAYNSVVSENGTENEAKKKTQLTHRRRKMIPFSNIEGYSGVFITGSRPTWLMMSSRRFLRAHPMPIDGDVVCFTQFHNINCHHGFLYFNSKGDMRISQLQPYMNYDMDWPIRKIPLRRSVTGIIYHLFSQKHAVLTATSTTFQLKDENIPMPPLGVGEFLPEIKKYALELVSPVTWETVDKLEFGENEHAMCIKYVELESKQTASGRKNFVAVGTSILAGEDISARGAIYIFDVIEVVPEPDNPQTNHKLKLLYREEVKGSVSALCDVNGYLVTCVGPKVIIRSFEDNESLVGVAFIDVQIYVTSASSVKNLILIGDVYKSIWFLAFQEEPAKLVLLGKDYHPLDIQCTNFLIDDKTLNFVVSDNDKNVHLFSYSPYNVQSFSGQKLIRRGDFHCGASVQTMTRIAKKPIPSEDGTTTPSRQHLCLCGTLDGSVQMIVPVSEKLYKRMQLLYTQLVNGLQHPAGLNPKAHRLVQTKKRNILNPVKNILDGDILSLFSSLAINRQKEMTKQIGTTEDRILNDLLEATLTTDYF
ncbi:mRNA cleavage and polyadenylation factor subunit [Basidiobolus ranarum]|uniref:mRNA cleavage and polyadenylation factor subunit n=1 Tax=Basidiobolus ranarum TaxID=34480 RepID=A0ABR2W9L0_9FUNG